MFLVAPDTPNFLGQFPMTEGSDFQEQVQGVNQISRLTINQTMRIICYNQVIYDDLRLEVAEYAGLTLQVIDSLSSVMTIVEPGYADSAILILDDDSETNS